MEERVRSFFSEYGVILILAGAGVVFLVFGIFHLTAPSEPLVISSESSEVQNPTEIFVDVAGAVERPGIYALSSQSRVADAIKKAGGTTDDADLEYIAKVLNKAQIVTDGQKIFIPLKNQTVADSSTIQQDSTSQGQHINLNTASASELDTLPGVGEVTAQKIIASRPYATVEEVKSKKAVNSATFEKIKDLVVIH
ncbi:MAG TPA: ComEA family DNA-binding protein [Candidatus Levybacteria bacterium]|nr:ComEA family DNA-binding protein [Candidatus Levybacteria bacterium]